MLLSLSSCDNGYSTRDFGIMSIAPDHCLLDDSRFCPQLWFDELIITVFSFDLFAFPNGNVPELQLFTL
jgi:hypothetical protein